jgi:hypothetical protein
MEQLYGEYYFVFIVVREVEDECRVYLEEKKSLEEIEWSMEVLSRFPVVGVNQLVVYRVYDGGEPWRITVCFDSDERNLRQPRDYVQWLYDMGTLYFRAAAGDIRLYCATNRVSRPDLRVS